MRARFRFVALGAFCSYLLLFPGSTITVALKSVPAWGVGMGTVLLMLQGVAAFAWLLGSYGRRGMLAGMLTFILAWAVEHIGETTGVLFGRYTYTDVLQPQIIGVVPVPITCAWMIVALGSWQLSGWLWRTCAIPRSIAQHGRFGRIALCATLVVALDLQIETVATLVNQYWIWIDSGAYYGVPTRNFVMWWIVGAGMALIVHSILPEDVPVREGALLHWRRWVFRHIPALMYLLSTLMFTVINIAYGYAWAAAVGVLLLTALLLHALWSTKIFGWPIAPVGASVGHQTSD